MNGQGIKTTTWNSLSVKDHVSTPWIHFPLLPLHTAFTLCLHTLPSHSAFTLPFGTVHAGSLSRAPPSPRGSDGRIPRAGSALGCHEGDGEKNTVAEISRVVVDNHVHGMQR